MNEKEYETKKQEVITEEMEKPTADNPAPLNQTTPDGVPTFAKRKQFIDTNKKEPIMDIENPDLIPEYGDTDNNIEKSRKILEKYGDQIPMHDPNKERELYSGKNITDLQKEDMDNIPDISEFLSSEEYLRNGLNVKIPVPITLNGREYKVWIRSLTSNEYYNLQLKQVREKKSLNYLAAVLVCEDGNGNKLPRKFWDELGFETTERIGEAISIASGSDGNADKVAAVVENFLND